ncbi:MAG: condensation domain-containing protein, partial [Rhizonema sp. PD38]|nr:condensation domain-containing protein [Rhizonema sp. PD38]
MQNHTIEGFRLSPQQKHLWSLQQDSSAYHTQCAIRLEGKLNTKILKEALQAVINQHEILRTTFPRRSGIKIPIQVIAQSSSFLWKNVNLSNINSQEKSVKIEELFRAERHFNFNFEQGPLLLSSLLT